MLEEIFDRINAAFAGKAMTLGPVGGGTAQPASAMAPTRAMAGETRGMSVFP